MVATDALLFSCQWIVMWKAESSKIMCIYSLEVWKRCYIRRKLP